MIRSEEAFPPFNRRGVVGLVSGPRLALHPPELVRAVQPCSLARLAVGDQVEVGAPTTPPDSALAWERWRCPSN